MMGLGLYHTMQGWVSLQTAAALYLYLQGTALAIKNLYSSGHPVGIPWSKTSGWNLANKFAIYFGNPGSSERSAFIWAIQFMKTQLTVDFVFTLKIGYYQDTDYSHASPTDWIHPMTAPDNQTGQTITVTSASLDQNGIFWLEDGASAQSFVASRVLIEKVSGPDMLNFDFIGTFYDFDTAKRGKHSDNKYDDWTRTKMFPVWIKGRKEKLLDIFYLS
jgi:hypothetical protein